MVNVPWWSWGWSEEKETLQKRADQRGAVTKHRGRNGQRRNELWQERERDRERAGRKKMMTRGGVDYVMQLGFVVIVEKKKMRWRERGQWLLNQSVFMWVA